MVASSSEVNQAIPALSLLAGGIGDPLVRRMGTIGGSLANSDPAADYPGAVVGLGAIIHTDRRRICADDYFIDVFDTALEEDEIIVRVEFPIPQSAGYFKFRNPASGYVVVGAFVARFEDKVRVAINGAGPCVFRNREMESALYRGFLTDCLDSISIPSDGLNEDIHVSAEYRANLIKVAAKRAIIQASDN